MGGGGVRGWGTQKAQQQNMSRRGGRGLGPLANPWVAVGGGLLMGAIMKLI